MDPFDFIAFTGVMRFVRTTTSEDTQVTDDETNDSNENDTEDSDHPSPIDDEFCLPKNALPSSSTKELKFRRRGEETGEGEIRDGSNSRLSSMTFESPNALRGFFSGMYGR